MRPARLLRAAAPALALLLCSSPSDAKDWDVRGRGRIVYKDGASWQPIAGARITLMDSDTDFDDTMGEGWSDATGHFDVKGRGGDPGLPFGICDDHCTRPDPYVTVALRNDRLEVETEIGFTWHADTAARSNTAGDVDFGSFQFASTDGQHAQILFARLTQQYDNYQRLVGGRIPRHDGKVNVLFPALLAAGVPWTTEESIHWPGGESRWDAVFHEFGHRIRHAADGDFAHFLVDVARFTYLQQHTFEKHTNQGYAFNEGWAEYHSTLLNATDRNTFTHWGQIPGGDEVEGNVAAKLTHLSDVCGGFKNLWAALTSASIHSYGEFEAALKKKFPACFRPMTVRQPLNLAALRAAPHPLDAQHAAVSRLVAHVSSPARLAVPVRAVASRAVAPQFKLQQESFNRVYLARKGAGEAVRKAAAAALQKHAAGLKPITLELAKSGDYLKQRQAARHGFLHDALTPQVAEIDKLLAALAREEKTPGGAPLAAHFKFLRARYEKRKAELRQALAAKPDPRMQIPIHLLPRSFAAGTVAAR